MRELSVNADYIFVAMSCFTLFLPVLVKNALR